MAAPGDLREGSFIRYKGELCQVLSREHYKPGKGAAFVRVKIKNFQTGATIEERMRPDDSVDVVRMESRPMQYLYRDGSHFVFMDNETFEQIPVDEDMVGDKADFLRENDPANLIFSTDDDKLLNVELPTFIVLRVTSTEPAARGDTVGNVTKPATLETGAVVQVPAFIDEGELIKVDTRTREYMGRESG